MENNCRLIDAYKLEDLVRSNSARYHHVDDVIAAIAGQPTVDVVEVVRCKDCKWYDADCEICVLHSEDGDTYDCGCDVNMKPEDFCSYGERRD